MSVLRSKIELWKFRKEWRLNNTDNTTIAMNTFSIDSVVVGAYTYGGIRVVNWNNEKKLMIGSFCSIAQDVIFILDADHYVNHLSSFPFKTKVIDGSLEGVSKGDIIIDDDVWIGYGSTILSGVHIGQGAVVAAGSVVTHSVPPYAIVGGVPAKVIKYRFNNLVIDFMLTLDYGSLTEEMIKVHINELYTEIDDMELEEIKKLYAWFPKKKI